MRECKNCGGLFDNNFYNRLYCSKECYLKYNKFFHTKYQHDKWLREKARRNVIINLTDEEFFNKVTKPLLNDKEVNI